MKILADGKPHDPSEIESLHLPKPALNAVLSHLASEEKIVTDNGKIKLNSR